MKLKECTYGRMVITGSKEVGFIKGLTYNVPVGLVLVKNYSPEELLDRTIPVVEFPFGDRDVHPSDLEPYE